MIRDFGLRDADERTSGVVHLYTRRPVRSRLRADGIFARRVDVLQIVIIDDLPPRVSSEVNAPASLATCF